MKQSVMEGEMKDVHSRCSASGRDPGHFVDPAVVTVRSKGDGQGVMNRCHGIRPGDRAFPPRFERGRGQPGLGESNPIQSTISFAGLQVGGREMKKSMRHVAASPGAKRLPGNGNLVIQVGLVKRPVQ